MTSYQVIFNRFIQEKIIKNSNFLYYDNIPKEEAEQLIYTKCLNLLNQAIDELLLNCSPAVDFTDKNDILGQFNFDVTLIEIGLLLELMKQKFLEQDEVRMGIIFNSFSSSELKQFSPANERDSFEKMMSNICFRNKKRIQHYMLIDRNTGKYPSLTYSNL